ncbi:MAG: pyruvate, phosphate dikinase [Spirochaetia bacterium]|nr:pyruvate, phosphate dikinase [Spirochaetia bacterium]
MYKLDPTWLPFSNLMLKHVYNVLLICSDYDRFLLEEDGRVEEALYTEYTQLGLSNPPKITHVNTPQEALELLSISNRKFELVISMLDLGNEHVEELADSIKEVYPYMPIVVLSPSPVHKRNKLIKNKKIDSINDFFYYQGDPMIFLAMIKLVEDRMNIDHDTNEADIQVIILVENSVRFYSSFLPILYKSLITQNRSSILEGLNSWGKILRMRGRPKILLAKTYEEALDLYLNYKNNILGIISDMSYDKDDKEDKYAGLKLCREVRKDNPRLPFLIQSMNKENEIITNKIGANFLWKKADNLLFALEDYVTGNYGFGPFVFKNPETNEKITEAKTMRQLQKALELIPIQSFIYHSCRDDFSRWLRAQSLYVLASRIKPIRVIEGAEEESRKNLIKVIKDYRAERTKGVLAQFSKEVYDETLFFSRIGDGSLGGKGRGLAFIDMELRASGILEKYPDVYLSIPRTVVISTHSFSTFIATNNLRTIIVKNISDKEMLKAFLEKPIQNDLKEDLKEIINVIHQPISVRSSSLLEDSHFQPFAGVYETCMLKNTGTDEERLNELELAIKTVWASTFFHNAKEYLKATEHMMEEEKMAIVIQQVIGTRHGDYWYPNISGVARSLNYYPIAGEDINAGVANISFGFGKSVVDNGSVFRFSPKNPKRPVHFLGKNQFSSQTMFYGLDLNSAFDPFEDLDNLKLLDIKEAEKYPESLKGCASTFDIKTGGLSESVRAVGEKIITFNGILKYDMFPLASIIYDILQLGKEAMSTPVEIEFAINLNKKAPKKPEFSLLQIRPIAEGNEESDICISDQEEENAIIVSHSVMGNGKIDNIKDIIMINLEEFDAANMINMPDEIEKMNSKFENNETQYILIVAGRLGSSDPWLGIPASWSQISNAKVIIETGLPSFQVEPSQGTHFFQNLTLLGTRYMTINPSFNDGKLEYNKIKELTVISKGTYFTHYKTEVPLEVKINGLKSKGIISLKN